MPTTYDVLSLPLSLPLSLSLSLSLSLCSVDIPDSCWQCYLVEWGDNKDTDRLSPWDMEPLPPSDSNGSEKAADAEEATAMEDDSEGDRVSQGGGDETGTAE